MRGVWGAESCKRQPERAGAGAGWNARGHGNDMRRCMAWCVGAWRGVRGTWRDAGAQAARCGGRLVVLARGSLWVQGERRGGLRLPFRQKFPGFAPPFPRRFISKSPKFHQVTKVFLRKLAILWR